MQRGDIVVKITGQKSEKIDTLLAFYNSGFPQSQWGKRKMELFFQKKNKGICLTVENGSAIKGLAIGRRSEKKSGCVVLSALLVSKDSRGNGYAKELMKLFIQEAFADPDVEKVILHYRVSKDLEEFYGKLGFGNHRACGSYKNGEPRSYMEISRSDMIQIPH
jgi:predicted GNAT family N-acyltransferase